MKSNGHELDMRINLLFPILLIGLAAVVAVENTITTPVTSSDKIKQFQSIGELQNYINNSYPGYTGNFQTTTGTTIQTGLPATQSLPSTSPSADKGTTEDYSKTNVQVAGVDEPDFVKNDGKYFYTISGNSVEIVDA